MRYGRHQHAHEERDLLGQRTLADLLGVSRKAVEKAVEAGRLDTFDGLDGKPHLHRLVSVQQWTENKCAGKVTSVTRGQRAAGMDAEAAKAVAHLPLTNPGDSRAQAMAVERAKWDPSQGPLDLTRVAQEKRELGQSRAEKERFQARLVQLKVMEKEGDLLDKAVFFQRAYSLAASIKDKLNGIPPQVAPQIVSAVEESLVAAGLPAEQAREIITRANLSHTVREAIRQGVTRALRDLTSQPMEDLIHG